MFNFIIIIIIIIVIIIIIIIFIEVFASINIFNIDHMYYFRLIFRLIKVELFIIKLHAIIIYLFLFLFLFINYYHVILIKNHPIDYGRELLNL